MTSFVVTDSKIFVKARKPAGFRDDANNLGAVWNHGTQTFEFSVPKDPAFRVIVLKGIIDFASKHNLI